MFSESAKDMLVAISFWNERFFRHRTVPLPFCMCLFLSTCNPIEDIVFVDRKTVFGYTKE